GLAAEGAADEHSGGGRYCGVSGDAGGQWHAHEACAQVARGAANQVTSCSAPALRAWERRTPAHPQSRGRGAACCAVSHQWRCSDTEHIGEARTQCRSTRPGCECQPAVAGLPAYPFRTGGGAPTQSISEKPGPTVGAPASGANASRRRSCRHTRFAPRAVLLRRIYRRSPNPLKGHPPRVRMSAGGGGVADRESTRLNSSHVKISYAVFCLKKQR